MNDEQELREENDIYEVGTQVTATEDYSYSSARHCRLSGILAFCT
jgi:hypothetical protein